MARRNRRKNRRKNRGMVRYCPERSRTRDRLVRTSIMHFWNSSTRQRNTLPMTETGQKVQASSINRALMVPGDWWITLLVREAFLGVCQFEQFQQKPGIPRQTLVKRLRERTANEIFSRVPYRTSPVRYEYRLISKSRDLYPYALMIWRWQRKRATRRRDSPPEHRSCFMADRWAHLVLTSVQLDCRHFDEIQSEWQITPDILAHRLGLLTDSGLLTKAQADDDARHSACKDTDRSRDIFPVSLTLLKSADRWQAGPEGPPTIRYHRPCDAALDARVTCSACNEELFPREAGFSVRESNIAAPGVH